MEHGELVKRLRKWAKSDLGLIVMYEAADTIEAQAAEIKRLRAALAPFAFLDMCKNEDEDALLATQDVWETIYRDRVQDWIAFEDIEAARAALGEME